MREVINIEGDLEWKYCQDPESENWVAVCDPLKLTVEADTLPELYESMSEAVDSLLNEMLSTGDLERFLKEHGWSAGPIPTGEDRDVQFDVPLNTRRVASHDLSQTLRQ